MTDMLQRLQVHKLWLALIALCFLMQFMQNTAAFDRSLIEQGEVWRLLSGHFTHLNWSHYGLNMAGVFMLMVFFANYQSSTYWLGAIVFIALLCSAGLMLDMQLNRYVGFSGVLHGLFIIGARFEMRRYKLSGVVLLVLIVAKLIWEQVFGAMPGSEEMTGGRVAVNAHLYGAIAGGLYLWLAEKFVANPKG
jgi:rhomboid family GlyGly-CTERM serine protease